jgi:hypothetical protein
MGSLPRYSIACMSREEQNPSRDRAPEDWNLVRFSRDRAKMAEFALWPLDTRSRCLTLIPLLSRHFGAEISAPKCQPGETGVWDDTVFRYRSPSSTALPRCMMDQNEISGNPVAGGCEMFYYSSRGLCALESRMPSVERGDTLKASRENRRNEPKMRSARDRQNEPKSSTDPNRANEPKARSARDRQNEPICHNDRNRDKDEAQNRNSQNEPTCQNGRRR